MTLKNATTRFKALGWEVERDALRKYKARPLGTLRWYRDECLETLLVVADNWNRRKLRKKA